MIKVIAFDMWQTLGSYKLNLYEEVLKLTKLNMSLEEFALKKSAIEVSNKLNDQERFVEKIRLMGVTNKVILGKIKGLNKFSTEKRILLTTLKYSLSIKALGKKPEEGDKLFKDHYEMIKRDFGEQILKEYKEYIEIYADYCKKHKKEIGLPI